MRSTSAIGMSRRREMTMDSNRRCRMARRTLSTCHPHLPASWAGVKCAVPSVAQVLHGAGAPAAFSLDVFIVQIAIMQPFVACPFMTRHRATRQIPNGNDSGGRNRTNDESGVDWLEYVSEDWRRGEQGVRA
jgi:hypothetical protein